ncbi:hypothetical protein MJG53_004349 [Ovis ammon polii x Ovis aries]|uniref:Uncharacterized protein n=1 Tax=Ovis ammon polii x Ovis aries TaxID=2918886 RepID=A0ACB9V9I9_9CETA|nr:hypothetical protein MJG53_004349 [Ovis ammon polii x Ovis aries]
MTEAMEQMMARAHNVAGDEKVSNIPFMFALKAASGLLVIIKTLISSRKAIHMTQLNDIIVRASGTVRQMYFLAKLPLQEKSLLFVGPTGTGEAALTNSFLRQLPHEKYVMCQINFTVQTSAKQTRDISLTDLERRLH